MISQREDEHVAKGLELLTDRYKGKAVIEALLTSYLNRVQELEDELWNLLWGWVLEWVDPDDEFNVYNAEGKQLDDLGEIVGEPRDGREDDAYIPAIKLRIRINRSKGQSEDMVQISHLINAAATYLEYFPLGWEVSIYNITTSPTIIRLLAEAKAASSYGVLLTSTWAEANVSKFDNAGDNVKLLGSTTTGGPDVRFPAALPTNPAYIRY